MVIFGSASEVAVGSKKGCEDAHDCLQGEAAFVAAVADGVTYMAEEGRPYPVGDPLAVAQASVGTVTRFLSWMPTSLGHHGLQEAIVRANLDAIAFNRKRGYLDEAVRDGFGRCAATTLVAAWLTRTDDRVLRGFVASIGDGVILKVSPDTCEMLSRDQLKAMQAYFGRRSFASTDERRRFQRYEVKNNPDITDERGERIGYGVIDGDPRALSFLDIREVVLAKGERLVLASDAIRACSTMVDPDDSRGYQQVADIAREFTSPQVIAEAIVMRIRGCEQRDAKRSDDATVVVIEG